MLVRMLTADGRQRTFDTQLRRFTESEVIPCFRCGVCCRGRSPLIGCDEAEAIARYLGMSVPALLDVYADPYPLQENASILRHDDWGCVFLCYEGKTAACTIYDVRPAACRAWQPSLRRPECLEGLRGLVPDGALVRPEALFQGESDLASFIGRLSASGP